MTALATQAVILWRTLIKRFFQLCFVVVSATSFYLVLRIHSVLETGIEPFVADYPDVKRLTQIVFLVGIVIVEVTLVLEFVGHFIPALESWTVKHRLTLAHDRLREQEELGGLQNETVPADA